MVQNIYFWQERRAKTDIVSAAIRVIWHQV